jgi:hypothetical protein
MLLLLASPLWAKGTPEDSWQDVEGQEIWQQEFNLTDVKPGKHNIIVRARDGAGNIAEDGPYNLRVDPNAGLPTARVVFPEAGSVLRQDINVIGVASGRFGINRVQIRLDDGAVRPAEGTEYWTRRISSNNLEEGRHTLYVQAVDSKETLGPETQITFILDKTPPVVDLLSHKTGELISGNITMQGRADDANGIASVYLSTDGGTEFYPLPFKTSRESGGAEFTFPFQSKRLNDGPVVYELRVTDTTGLSTTKPYLFFVDNIGPALEIISPAEGEDAFGTVRVTGKIDDAVGLQKLYYEWNGETVDIPLRPGDPYWTVDVTVSAQNRSPVFLVTAVDKSGNTTVLNRRLQDNRRLKVPSIQIDYPAVAGLNALPLYEAVYGRIAEGFIAESILIEGVVEEIPAQPGFRIPAELIPQGRSTLRLWAKAADGTVGAPMQLRINKPAPAPLQPEETPPPEPGASTIVISSPAAYSFFRDSLILKGNIARPQSAVAAVPDASLVADLAEAEDISTAAEISTAGIGAAPAPTPSALENDYAALLRGGAITLQFRLYPEDSWKNISVNSNGSFETQISVTQEEGPVHLELRTIQGGIENLPLYHPLNRASSNPDIQFLSPAEGDVINGNVTISGRVISYVPITDISYSLDGESYTPLTLKSEYQKSEFSLVCDFTTLEAAGGAFSVKVSDSSGAVFDKTLNARVNNRDDVPSVILNQPGDKDVITGNFEISGIAFDDDGVAAVYWRIQKKEEAPAEGGHEEAGAEAAAAEAAAAGTDTAGAGSSSGDAESGADESGIGEFQRVLTDQSFQIPVALFSQISDGEHLIEMYAEDIYGVRSETLARTIRVSTAPPTAVVIEPVMDIYNRKTIYIKGSAEDANGIAEVWISMDNGNTYQRTDGAEEWQISLNTNAYADGVYAVLIKAMDNYGIEAVSDALLNIDNTPPELSFGSPGNGDSTGTLLRVAARVQDNIEIKELSLELIGVTDTNHRTGYEIEDTLVILKSIDVSQMPPGEYNVRLSATDLAGNNSVITRNINVTTEVSASEAALFNPLPGETHSGPITISGRVSGALIPNQIQLWANKEPLSITEVDRYGYFHYEYPEERLKNGPLLISASYNTPTGELISSSEHAVNVALLGPIVVVDSHKDGDIITGRPWLKGRAWIAEEEIREEETGESGEGSGEGKASRKDKKALAVTQILVSFDNGRSFQKAQGREEWKFRLETGQMSRGALPVLIRAEFADGRFAIRRLIMTVDTTAPEIRTLEPAEDSLHRDSLLVYGTASDEYEIESIQISLRPGDKAAYSVPQFIQGLYLDTNIFGATYADGGFGMTFFDNNVKLQFQAGIAPNSPSRYPGFVVGAKLLANIFVLPFEYFFGPDWSFFSMSLALGANFSYFTMNGDSPAQMMGAVVTQWEYARVNIPQWKYFKTFSLYLEPMLWFTSSDVEDAEKFVFRVAMGFRVGIF